MKNPTFAITSLFTAFVACAYAFGIYLFPTMIPDMRGELSYTPQTVGLISGLTQGGLMAGGLLIGHIWHWIGAGRTILLTQFLLGICLLLTAYVSGIVPLTALCVIMGACAAFMWIPMTPFVQAHIPQNRHGIALGIMGGGTSYGVFLNGLFIPPVIEHSGWRMVWILAGIATIILLFIGLYVLAKVKPMQPVSAETTQAKAKTSELLGDRSAVVVILITLLNGLAFLPFETYLTSVFRDEHGWSISAATGLWSSIGVGGMLGGIGFGLLTDRIGPKAALVIANGFLAASALVTWLSSSLYIVYAALFIFGIGYNGVFGIMAAYVARTMSPARAGLLLGLSYIALGLGSLVGNFTGGLLAGFSGGYFILYGLVTALAVANVILTFGLRKTAN